MKERPILFRGEMMRAILDGRKTQTRRIIKPQPGITEALMREMRECFPGRTDGQIVTSAWLAGFIDEDCPYGHHGDRLWVKETYGLLTGAGHRYVFRADGTPMQKFYPDEPIANMKWKPSIFMRRELSRITLEITDVSVERLQDISEDDAKAEGVEWGALSHAGMTTARDAFSTLWNGINGAGAWAANPWVWAITFKRVAQ